jgi:hypothetical protein
VDTPKRPQNGEAEDVVDIVLREKVVRLESRIDYIERSTETLRILTDSVVRIERDLHAAKIGGRWLIGSAVTVGGILGWVVNLWFERTGR